MDILEFFIKGYFKSLLKEYGILERQIIMQNIMALVCFFLMLFLTLTFFPYHNALQNMMIILIVGIICGVTTVYAIMCKINKQNRSIFLGRIFPLFISIDSKLFSKIFGKNMSWIYFTWLFVFYLIYDLHKLYENSSIILFLFMYLLISYCWSGMNFFIILFFVI